MLGGKLTVGGFYKIVGMPLKDRSAVHLYYAYGLET